MRLAAPARTWNYLELGTAPSDSVTFPAFPRGFRRPSIRLNSNRQNAQAWSPQTAWKRNMAAEKRDSRFGINPRCVEPYSVFRNRLSRICMDALERLNVERESLSTYLRGIMLMPLRCAIFFQNINGELLICGSPTKLPHL